MNFTIVPLNVQCACKNKTRQFFLQYFGPYVESLSARRSSENKHLMIQWKKKNPLIQHALTNKNCKNASKSTNAKKGVS